MSSKGKVEVIEGDDGEREDGQGEDGQGLDPSSTSWKRWVTLFAHSRHMEREVDKVLEATADWIDDADIREAVRIAALYHDAGKAHPEFQKMLRKEGEGAPEDDVLLAKSKGERENVQHAPPLSA